MLGTLGLGVIAALTVLYTLYQYLLPKPIAGIPYNKEATQTLLGDVAAIQKESSDNIFGWIISQARRHGPIFQLWLGPCQKPTVIITDFREGQDILLRRKEFDRASIFSNVMSGEARSFHLTLPTGPQWKSRRRLLQDLMGPSFLHNVAAFNIYNSVLRLVDLWKKKAELANGRPFSASHDIFHTALDAVLDFGFGDLTDVRALTPQIDTVNSLSESKVRQLQEAATDGKAVDFPDAAIHPALEATMHVLDYLRLVAASGVPKLLWLIIGLLPRVRRGRAVRDEWVMSLVLRALEKFKALGAEHNDTHVKSAIDFMLARQHGLAEKESGTAQQRGNLSAEWITSLRDEILGFIVAGHDTSSTTMCWVVKFLSDNPDVQQKLLESLRSFHSAAVAENRLPTHSEMCRGSVPYLDAVVEESLRLGHTSIFQDRDATEDTIILGHHIPKGTHVMVTNKGPSFTEPGLVIEENLRSASCQAAGKEYGIRAWDEEGMEKFRPERWLKQDGSGVVEFDPTAGPTIPFGLGLRGCFGRKLAYIELKLLTTLLVWNFEFQNAPKSLSSYVSLEDITRKPAQCYVRLKVRSST